MESLLSHEFLGAVEACYEAGTAYTLLNTYYEALRHDARGRKT